jgi:hypothetical protein
MSETNDQGDEMTAFEQAKAGHPKRWLVERDGTWVANRREFYRDVDGQPRQVDGKASVWLASCQGCNWQSGRTSERKVRRAIRQHNLGEARKLTGPA